MLVKSRAPVRGGRGKHPKFLLVFEPISGTFKFGVGGTLGIQVVIDNYRKVRAFTSGSMEVGLGAGVGMSIGLFPEQTFADYEGGSHTYRVGAAVGGIELAFIPGGRFQGFNLLSPGSLDIGWGQNTTSPF